jgi:4-amino-4-deoxy-L-arabinose transferase-like glycosyltransferase
MTKRYLIIALVLLAVALSLRLVDLRADAPANFAGGGQDLTTDGSYLTLYARNAVLFGTWDPCGYPSWSAFKITLVSGLSYLLFLFFGTSLVTSNLTGVLLNFAALCLFLFVLRRLLTPRAWLLTAVFLALSFELTVYGRQPFAENGLLFLASLTFLAFTRWFDKSWGRILVGVLIAMGAMFGKSFGFLFAVGPLVWLILQRKQDHSNKFWLSIVEFAAPLVLVTLVITLLTGGKGSFLSFLWEHGVEEHGLPKGINSIKDYFEALISFPRTGLHRYAPVVSLLAYLALLRLLLARRQSPERSKLIIFMVSWLVAWVIALSPFNYQPTRYLFVLVVPLSVLAAQFLDSSIQWNLSPSRPTRGRLILMTLLNWYASFVVLQLLVNDPLKTEVYLGLVWYALPAGLALTGCLWLLTLKWRGELPDRWLIPLVGLFLGLFVLAEARQFYDSARSRTYTLAETSEDIASLLSPNAVIAGQYGPAVASQTHLQSFPYFLTSDYSAMTALLRQYPITHLAVSAIDWNLTVQSHPELKAAPIEGVFWLRDNNVYLIRVSSLTESPRASSYQLTAYEQAIDYERRNLPDSAHAALAEFLRAHPTSKNALVEQYYVELSLLAIPDIRPQKGIIDTLLAHYDTDFSIDVLGAAYYKWYFENTHDGAYDTLSRACLEKAMWHNRKNEQNLRARYDALRPGARILH